MRTALLAPEIGVTIPKFADDVPFTIVIAVFDEGVQLTGQLRGADSVERGDRVAVGAETPDGKTPTITFSPV